MASSAFHSEPGGDYRSRPNGVSRVWNSTIYFCTVVKSDKPRLAQFSLLTPGGESWHHPERFVGNIWLSGTPVQVLDTLFLPKGFFPLMIEVSYTACEKADGRFWMAPRFQDVGPSGDAISRP